MAVLVFLAFVIGAVTVLAVEVLVLWILIRRLSRSAERRGIEVKDGSLMDTPPDFTSSLPDKQGFVWVLEADKVPTSVNQDKASTERRSKKDFFAVIPVRKYARLKDHCLSLHEQDGSLIEISLRGCTVVAVSASSMPSRKWAKRYPIKVEHNESVIYKGSMLFYIYLETSWEKEAWCKSLRLCSSENDEKIIWFSELTRDFQTYLDSLSAGYPSYVKPSVDSYSESKDKSVKLDNASSKIRQFIKKLAKKSSKAGSDYKAGGASVPVYEERKIAVKSFSLHHTTLEKDSSSNDPETRKHTLGVSVEDPSPVSFNEGALCLNMLVSRLFFDVKNNSQILASIQSRFQRTLSNMRIPSYIGEVVCTAVNLGTLPPHILSMRVLPSDLSEVWSLEVTFEYRGGMVLDIETWLRIQELESEGESVQLASNSGREVTSDLLEGLEHFGEQLHYSVEKNDETEKDERYLHSDETDKSNIDGPAPSYGNRWKSIVHSIAKQVSQVPLSMGIRISSLNGTLQLSLKPPPSNEIWFGFATMPNIEFNVETSVGDVKIASGRVSQFLINRIKAVICENLVLPNYESLAIPWMLAEKDDWVPRRVAPFACYRGSQDSNIEFQKQDMPLPLVEAKQADEKQEISPPLDIPKKPSKPVVNFTLASNPVDESALENGSLQGLRSPLLNKDKVAETSMRNTETKSDIQVDGTSDDDSRQRRIGTRERMRGLSKKMGEKLDVKRRHIEEKGRSFVEKMRGQ